MRVASQCLEWDNEILTAIQARVFHFHDPRLEIRGRCDTEGGWLIWLGRQFTIQPVDG